MRFEDRHYVPEQPRWPDFRFDRYREGWCAGRAGIGLTRLRMFETDRRPVLRRDLDRALGGLDHDSLAREDQVCCGNFSRVEFLLRASRVLDVDAYWRQAEELATDAVHRAEQRGEFSVPWQTDNWYAKSLFLGEPGIGYSLLRLAGADLPCLLLWE
ncbi:hypothetical protein I7X12_05835 [Halosimplex litoreum]|uniref:Uncharacterized protein n=1 Tax=Halosimplex litoreum TaxID=1198301 RepID=A0A7U3WBP6_9EURY|nr:lanthionine synthetase LanC family protein [Halosimplex litoreum]QPV65041.1 hypothetical protein I7X12_05835 [Halosimplex litoreum]